jgi:hypothetical protein
MEPLSTISITTIARDIFGSNTVTYSKSNGISTKDQKVPKYQAILLEMLEHKIYFSKAFEGWHGIDSKLPMIVLYFAHYHKLGKPIFKPRKPNKDVAAYLDKVFALYKDVCGYSGLKFVPTIPAGLEKICKKSNKADEEFDIGMD